MANEIRLRADYKFGTLTAAINTTATTLQSAEFAGLPVVDTTNHLAITLYDDVAKAYEIVYVTAHAASSTSATVLRAQAGTTGRAWSLGATWLHGPTVNDFPVVAATAPTGSAALWGRQWYDTVNKTLRIYDAQSAAWPPVGPTVPMLRIRQTADQAFSTGVWTTMGWTLDSNTPTAKGQGILTYANNSITVQQKGLYLIHLQGSASGGRFIWNVLFNGSVLVARGVGHTDFNAVSTSGVVAANPGDYFSAQAWGFTAGTLVTDGATSPHGLNVTYLGAW